MPFPANYFEKLVLLSVDTLTPWPDLLLSIPDIICILSLSFMEFTSKRYTQSAMFVLYFGTI